MAKNARQRRAAKRKLALTLLALERNPSMVAQKGYVRASASSPDDLKVKTHTGFRASFQGKPANVRKSVKRFALDGFK